MTSTMLDKSVTRPTVPRTLPMLLTLDGASRVPRYRQIYHALRRAIVGGRLPSGARLPATRTLAEDLGVSRITVLGAYDELAADGLITARAGAGTVVSAHARHVAAVAPLSVHAAASPRPAQPGDRLVCPFAPGLCALDAFPAATWARLVARRWRAAPRDFLLPDEGPGHAALRRAIAQYVLVTRAVSCTADHVIVTAGARQAIDLAARVLLDPGDVVLVEDPGDPTDRVALASIGARVVSVPVDAEGFDVTAAQRVTDGRLALVTPSHQTALGVALSERRRVALLEWAADAEAWIVESDTALPVDACNPPSLRSIDHPGTQRVIHVGSFDATLVPALRIGYAIVRPGLVDAFVDARRPSEQSPSIADQSVLAEFIADGQLARHVRRTRTLASERRRTLLQLASRELRGLVRFAPTRTGLHLVGWLPPGVSDARVAREAARRGIRVGALSAHRTCPTSADPQAVLLGYAPFVAEEMRCALERLAEVIRACC